MQRQFAVDVRRGEGVHGDLGTVAEARVQAGRQLRIGLDQQDLAEAAGEVGLDFLPLVSADVNHAARTCGAHEIAEKAVHDLDVLVH